VAGVTQIALSGVAVEFGADVVLENVSFTVGSGERWGIIGRNGAGKTTIFNLITGRLQPTRGVVTSASGVRFALLEQHRDFGEATTVWEAVAGSFSHLLALEQSLADQATKIGELGEAATPQMMSRYDRDLERFEHDGGYTFAPRVDAVLHGLGFDPGEARTRGLERLSGGERGRVGLARQLVAPADVLLLDEPTNHLDLETTEWLERYLADTGQTVLLISHDRAFLANLVDHVLHVEHHTAVAYAGRYEAFVAQRAERRLTQQRAFDKQRRFIAEEEDYIRRNLAGQNTKQAKGRRKRLERLPRFSAPLSDDAAMALRFTANDRGGDQVLVADKVSLGKRGDAHETLVVDFSAVVHRGDRVGFIGPNGAGKTTLLEAIVGRLTIARGMLRVGSGITVAYYRQDLAQVPLDRTIYNVISELRPLWERGQIQGHLGRFGFSGDEVQRDTGTLSGGERARVALAIITLSGANLLVLDEPTNHLDVESIEALEDAVEAYEGSVILVSHDRELLRGLTTRLWVLHDRHITTFDGDFGEWEVASAERAHAASVQAAEEEALRRVRERQRTQRRSGSETSNRDVQRKARRDVENAEADVATLEAKVGELTAALGDPELYATGEGVTRARQLGVELDTARAALDAALERWARATEVLESVGG
jgi:ATP-binding cassette, subfamily F, member 3